MVDLARFLGDLENCYRVHQIEWYRINWIWSFTTNKIYENDIHDWQYIQCHCDQRTGSWNDRIWRYVYRYLFQFFFQEIEPFSPFKCKLIFLKLYNKEELNLAIKSPIYLTDLFQMDLVENYRNISYKTLSAYQWLWQKQKTLPHFHVDWIIKKRRRYKCQLARIFGTFRCLWGSILGKN